MKNCRWSLAASVGLLVLTLHIQSAQAWSFNEARGQLETTGEVAWDCEASGSLPEGLSLTVFDTNSEPVSALVLGARFGLDDKALEGGGAFEFGGDLPLAAFDLTRLKARFAGRRVAVRLWAQPRGTTLGGRLFWYAGPVEGERDQRDYIGSVSLKPTGQVTTDGWRELSTGPFDWLASGAGPLTITIQDSQYDGGSFLLVPDATQRVGIDAFEIEDLGPAIAPEGACTGASSASVCGQGSVCLWGGCVDGAILTNGLPSEILRADYLQRRAHQFQVFEGGVLPQSKMDALVEAFEALEGASAPHVFWQGMKVAVSMLQDGHASAPLEDFRGGFSAGVCLAMGEADLIPGGGALPMVFALGGETPFSEALQVGDVLLAVDGVEPYRWLESLALAPVHSGDPIVADYVLTRSLFGAALAAGSRLTFGRCQSDEEGPCAEGAVEEIELDLAELQGPAPGENGRPAWVRARVACDYRFSRWVDENPNRAARYSYAGAAQREETTYLLINGTPDPQTRNGDWGRAVTGGLGGEPGDIILDHRSGGGGTVTGVNLVAGYLLDPEGFGHIDWFPYYEDGLSPARYEAAVRCQSAGLSTLTSCSGAYHWDIFENHPDPGLHRDKPLAVVIGQDVSGNDFLTLLLSFREAPTRIFGSPATYGAFGTVVGLPSMPGEFSGGAVQISDAIFFQNPYAQGDGLPAFTTGLGVRSDELVLQKQSDALRGVDTVLTRAQQWLDEEAQP